MSIEGKVKILKGFGEKYPILEHLVGKEGEITGKGKSGEMLEVSLGRTHAIYVEPEYLENVK